MQLTALQSKSLLKILSTPSVSTLDNQMAYTENGQKVPYVSTTSLGGTEVQFVDAVLRLEITPHVISDDYLKLQILVTNDEVDFTHEVSGNPVIDKKQTRTTLICRNGETIVIAGLTQNTTTKSNVACLDSRTAYSGRAFQIGRTHGRTWRTRSFLLRPTSFRS